MDGEDPRTVFQPISLIIIIIIIVKFSSLYHYCNTYKRYSDVQVLPTVDYTKLSAAQKAGVVTVEYNYPKNTEVQTTFLLPSPRNTFI